MALILNSVSVWLLDFHNNDEDVDDNGDKEMGKKGIPFQEFQKKTTTSTKMMLLIVATKKLKNIRLLP
ncbi:hypothetical protein DERF_009565 [Dermatophagoides farinae]|uniref:Uncharacterized protein n=1 Tax=Dermatophagoides farinae TaxID=6954 RepID=A0A922HV90_DERFA|nr:hypothetical protein DERF_009565 [Dermatophagoides farinae]